MNVLPKSVSVQNYRSFRGRHEVELKPLTLIYGANNVGKSALVRLLPLIGDSVAVDATGALRLESPAAFGAGFADLESKRAPDPDSSEPTELGLTLTWEEGPLGCAEFVFERLDKEGVVIRELDLQLADGRSDRFTRVPLWDPSEPFIHQYDRLGAGQADRMKLGLRGLVPTEIPDGLASLVSLRDALGSLRGSIQWLRAQRATPERRLARPSGPVTSLTPDGENAPAALLADPTLAESVSAWYRSAFRSALLLHPEPPDEFRCQLESSIHTSSVRIDLVDSGNGPTQALPVAVACMLAQRSRHPQILAIEEPDANLDVPTQRRLAELLVQTAAASSRPRVVIETHSEALLLGVQLAVAQANCGLAPEDVAIYWVEQDEFACSSICAVTIDGDGRLQGNWPDPFGQLRELARELVSLRMQRSAR